VTDSIGDVLFVEFNKDRSRRRVLPTLPNPWVPLAHGVYEPCLEEQDLVRGTRCWGRDDHF
jgi:hypothetical protein